MLIGHHWHTESSTPCFFSFICLSAFVRVLSTAPPTGLKTTTDSPFSPPSPCYPSVLPIQVLDAIPSFGARESSSSSQVGLTIPPFSFVISHSLLSFSLPPLFMDEGAAAKMLRHCVSFFCNLRCRTDMFLSVSVSCLSAFVQQNTQIICWTSNISSSCVCMCTSQDTPRQSVYLHLVVHI